ncbi:MAG: phosphoribosylanthranilate isomerase [Bacteroidales bacterium]|jgi:phosphoribosylanthranilate isomerase|nr:phosphoribosylanthranilate isomerase [Bacteroidales bacterium]
MLPKVKICCIANLEEAKIAIQSGASAIGLVGNMPSGPGIISDEKIHSIAKNIPPHIDTFLLTSETDAQNIINHHKKTNTNTIQLVDHVNPETYQELKLKIPGVKLVQVIHVIDQKAIDKAVMISGFVDAILLDSGNPNLKIKELGGTGRTHNWDISKEIVQQSKKPVFLAGGLNPENIRKAIDYVKPYGVDICSGVRTHGKLDLQKLQLFFTEIKKL